MDITITLSTDQERAISHILAYNRLHGANETTTVAQYVTTELNAAVVSMATTAEKVRKQYIDETTEQLDPTQVADLAEFIYNQLNS